MDVIAALVGLFIILVVAAFALVAVRTTIKIGLFILVWFWPMIVGMVGGAVAWWGGFDNVGALIGLSGIIVYAVWWRHKAEEVLTKIEEEPSLQWLLKH